MKPVKPDLKMGNITVSTLEELRSNPNHHLLGEYRAKRLERFLRESGHDDLADEINSIQATEDFSALESLCLILGIDHTITIPHEVCNKDTQTKRTEEKTTSKTEEGKMSTRYNVVIVGQTGVGKSELINYLYGHTVVKSGVGKPVTKNGFHPINLTINSLPVTIFDSWGIEVSTYKQWIDELEQELRGRGLDKSADHWFHSVYYCINASSTRVQEADIDIIKRFQKDTYNVNVILTKADAVSEEKAEELSKEIKKQVGDIAVIPVCSVAEIRRGHTVPSFGKEDVEIQAYRDFYASLAQRLPERCGLMIENTIKAWANKQMTYIDRELKWGGFNSDQITSQIQKTINDLTSNIPINLSNEIKNTLLMYNQFRGFLGYPPSSFDVFSGMRLTKHSTMEYFEDYDYVFDFGDFVNNVGTTIIALPRAAFRYLTNAVGKDERNKLIHGIEKLKEEMLSRVPTVKENIKTHLQVLRDKASTQGNTNDH
jgi:GTP-binding protein EngB required for normal cell division